ncbi:MAG TPA: sigma 54-interacting transcriptional regulator [Pirellulaceae bacterium]|nr:sigma 54-interacting transcriptional regulator [Pirellulaceae bacterium]
MMKISSQTMQALVNQARRFAQSSACVLITGESGTGKELLSRLIHNESQRAENNYIAVNCAALPELLIESELFGHERGAFTGAFQERIGHFQHAHRGTILLDEISEIPLSIQAKLLRVIEEQEVIRIGASQPIKIDVRIVATSNRNLAKAVASETFRLDLFHRLSVLRLMIPPLRERVDDIPPLAEHFLQKFRHEAQQNIKGFTNEAIKELCSYDWPGNVRELRNVIHCACVVCDGSLIDTSCFPHLHEQRLTRELQSNYSTDLNEIEKQAILATLEKYRGNKTAAAAELGVTPRTLSNKLKIYKAAG